MLQMHEMDFHYHAGQERNNKTLREHLVHAAATGRKVVGLTDHYGRYFPNERNLERPHHYPVSLRGLREYARELDALRGDFPNLTLYFAPELSPAADLGEVPDEVHEISDYYICEPTGIKGTAQENTDALTRHLHRIAEFSRKTQKRVYLAHPFRASVNLRLVSSGIAPDITALQTRPGPENYDPGEAERFFLLDVVRLGQEAAALGIPLEVNGETHNRIRVTNLPAPLKLLWAAYLIMKKQGASFVPGSDQHDFQTGRYGAYVPFDCFEAIGVQPEEIGFMRSSDGFPECVGIPV